MSQYYKGTMNNNSWLKSAGQWNDGTVYTGMYNWLLEQMNAGVSGFVSSTAAYTDYDFVINTTDQTFRLPLLSNRVLVEKKELTDSDSTWYNLYSDGWLEQGGLGPSGSGEKTITLYKPYSNANYTIMQTPYSSGGHGSYSSAIKSQTNTSFVLSVGSNYDVGFYWTTCGYTDNAQNTGWNLYYYIGDTLQNAQLINVARIEEKLTDVNAASRGYVVESYHNGTEWYRIYSDGWCEQGFYDTSNADHVVTLLTPMADKNYVVSIGQSGDGASASVGRSTWKEKTATTLKLKSVTPTDWVIAGYKA